MIKPQLVVIAGPNGAGKSTSAPALLPEGMPFLNADDIAARLVRDENGKEIAAGRVFLAEWDRLESLYVAFAIETTLASSSLVGRIRRMKKAGYEFHLIFLWLPNVNFAIERVAERVRMGGHNIPTGMIRRRYERGLSNFFKLYRPLADTWGVYINSISGRPDIVATGKSDLEPSVILKELWEQFYEKVS
jgi:predicted ABC-type ATPase